MTDVMGFERVSFRDGGHVRRVWAMIMGETSTFLRIREVDFHGDDKSYERKDGTIVDVQRLIDKSVIISRKPAQMNRTYGTMEYIRGVA